MVSKHTHINNKLRRNSGHVYEGDLKKNELTGTGVLKYKPKEMKVKYSGELVEGKRHGNGILYW